MLVVVGMIAGAGCGAGLGTAVVGVAGVISIGVVDVAPVDCMVCIAAGFFNQLRDR